VLTRVVAAKPSICTRAATGFEKAVIKTAFEFSPRKKADQGLAVAPRTLPPRSGGIFLVQDRRRNDHLYTAGRNFIEEAGSGCSQLCHRMAVMHELRLLMGSRPTPGSYRPAGVLARKWDREFESGSLQQRVCCELTRPDLSRRIGTH
jgi:hypothetical protein